MNFPEDSIIDGGAVFVPFRLKYSRDTAPTVSEVVDSLLGMEAMAKRLPKVVSALVGVPIGEAVVTVNRVKTGSLYDDIVVKLVFGGQEQMDLFLKEMHDRFMQHKAIPVLALAAMVGIGVYSVYSIFGDRDGSSSVVNSYNTNIVNVISLDSGKSVADVERILKSVTTGPAELKIAKDSLKLLSAARAGGDFEIEGAPAIRREIIEAIPAWKDVEEVDEVVRMDSVELNVRSMDLDSDRKGWFVVIPSVSDERIKMNVDDGVDKFAVVPGRPLMADVSVYYRVADGVRTANRCVMHAVR
jgi:hypothetical protein